MSPASTEATTTAEDAAELRQNEMRAGDRLLRLQQVLELVPLARSTWWAGVRAGRFPAPVRLGPRLVAWRYRDIQHILKNGTAS
jgi:prophage regulatory protein